MVKHQVLLGLLMLLRCVSAGVFTIDGKVVAPPGYDARLKNRTRSTGEASAASVEEYDYYYRIGKSLATASSASTGEPNSLIISGIGELPHVQIAAALPSHGLDIVSVQPHQVLEHILANQSLETFSLFNNGWAPLHRTTPMKARFTINDPGFSNQTFFVDPYGPNMNIQPAWDAGITGSGVTLAVVDDGLDTQNLDLTGNYYAASSYDFNDNVNSPDPKDSSNQHGTSCAGLAGATANTTCGVGAAFNVRLAGIRVLGAAITESQEASALGYKSQVNDIYSCSWGPFDDGATVAGPGSLSQSALYNGVTAGRGGKGNIYVFASGNGGNYGDHCGYDGYASNVWVMSVAAIDQSDKVATFGERCSAIMVSTYGVDDFTTAVNNQCRSGFSGTSASAPLLAGVAALVLQYRPQFTWRDVTDVLRKAAVPVDTSNTAAKWVSLPWGLSYSESYGYGKVDVGRAITVAGQHTMLGVMVTRSYSKQTVNAGLSYNMPVSHNFNVTDSSLFKVERVTVTVWIQSNKRGALSVMLTSPKGVVSYLAEERSADTSTDGLSGWTFSSVKHWGEQAYGTWKLTVNSGGSSSVSGTFSAWQLGFVGENAASAMVQVPALPVYTYASRLGPFTPLTLGLASGAVLVVLGGGAVAFNRYRRRTSQITPAKLSSMIQPSHSVMP